MSSSSVIKIFVLRLMVLKMVLHKYKIDVKLDLVFTILEPYLQIININDYIFQITLLSCKPITINLLFLEHKIE